MRRVLGTAGVLAVVLSIILETRSFNSKWGLGAKASPNTEFATHFLFGNVGKPHPLTTYPINSYKLDLATRTLLVERTFMPYKWDLGMGLHALRLLRCVEANSYNISYNYRDLVAIYTRQSSMKEDLNITYPVIIDTLYGINYISSQQPFTSSQPHVDNFLAEFGELGIPLSQPIASDSQELALIDCLGDSMMRANEKKELEWTIPAYCSYLRHHSSWVGAKGRKLSVDLLATRLLDKQPGVGPCVGTHREYALARLASAARETKGFISDRTAARVNDELRKISATLLRTQKSDGSWSPRWFDLSDSDQNTNENSHINIIHNLDATAHILEWSSICPPDLRLSDDRLIRAAHFCTVHLLESTRLFHSTYTGSTHAVRAVLQLSSNETN